MLNTDMIRLFKLVYETHSLSGAARRFPLSGSSASRMLESLRRELGDKLFYRSDNRMFPTARARELYPEMLRLLAGFERIQAKPVFSPEAESRVVRIGCLDLDLVSILSGPLSGLRREAPGIRINFLGIGPDFAAGLRKGSFDLVLYPTTQSYPGIRKLSLCTDAFVYVCRPGSTLARKREQGLPISEDEVRERLSVQVTVPVFNADNTRYGQFSEDVESSAFPASVWTPFFATVPFLLEGDETTFIPFQEARFLQRFLPLSILGRPSSLKPYETMMLWSEQSDGTPCHQWLRSYLFNAIRQGAAPPDGVPVLS